MNQSMYYERKTLANWSCQDVDSLYEKIAKVGSGTYGEVNKARLRSDPTKLVALKKIKDQSETQGFPITAMREINILQQCDHPNIVTLHNVVTSNLPDPDRKKRKKCGSTFLVFEYMEHELLGLVQSYHFNSSQVKCIMKQILQGLDYIHSKNIIHRDIKSANILMNNQGQVKIADFGLARKIEPSYNGKLTLRVVTRWYRAPELLLGSKKYTSQIDIWALGCVFAELLMGKSHALFPAQKTPDQFALICETCGTPSEFDWPGHRELPHYNTMVPKKHYPRILLQYMRKQNKSLDPQALDLLDKMLTFNPDYRITTQQALEHPYFNTSPLPCEPHEMPKFDKECHAYVLNLKRKAKVNLEAVAANAKNLITIDNTTNNNTTNTNFLLNKAPVPTQTLCPPSNISNINNITNMNNISYYEPINMMQGQQAKTLYGMQGLGGQMNQQINNDGHAGNGNGAMNQYMPQNTPALTTMKSMNGYMNMNHNMNQMNQMNDMNAYNNMGNLGNMNHMPSLAKMGSMQSTTTTNTYTSGANTYASGANMDNFTDNLSNLSNLSNISSISNMSNMNNINNINPMSNISTMNTMNNMSTMNNMGNMNPGMNNSLNNLNNLTNINNSMNNMSNINGMSNMGSMSNVPVMNTVLTKQNSSMSNMSGYNYPNNTNTNNNYKAMQDKPYLNYLNYQYYLLMNSSLPHLYNTNTNMNPMMNPNPNVPEYNPPGPFMAVKEPGKVKENPVQKPKQQSKRAKQPAKNSKAPTDVLDDNKVLETLNELDYDFLDFYNDHEGSLNCKRKGSPGGIPDFDQLVKKRQLSDLLGVE